MAELVAGSNGRVGNGFSRACEFVGATERLAERLSKARYW